MSQFSPQLLYRFLYRDTLVSPIWSGHIHCTVLSRFCRNFKILLKGTVSQDLLLFQNPKNVFGLTERVK